MTSEPAYGATVTVRRSRGLGGHRGPAWMLAGLILVALNLRAPISAVSALLDPLRKSLRLTGTEVSVLTTLPTVCLAVFAFLGPVLRRRLGDGRLIALSVLVLLAGELIRSRPSVTALFGGTTLVVAAIGVVNGVVPGLIKRHFPHRYAGVTALYTVALTVGASGASAAAPQLGGALHSSWSLPLFVITIPLAVLAGTVWSVELPRHSASGAPARTPSGLWRDGLAWQVTVFFGCTGLTFYFILGWLPTICDDRGMGSAAGGLVLALTSLVQVAGSLSVPMLVRRLRDQRWAAAGVGLANIAGLAGVILAPAPAGVWAATVVLGLAQGAGFGLAMTLIGLRAPDPAAATALSGMAQGVGYVIAIAGPLGAGLLHGATGGWTLVLIMMIAVCVLQLAAGLGAGRTRHVLAGAATRPNRSRR